jgi:hypothetical protein
MTDFWNNGVHTKREIMANRPDVIIKNILMYTSGRKCHAKGSSKETEIQAYVSTDTTNVENEMCDYTGTNWSYRNSNKMFKEKFRSLTK